MNKVFRPHNSYADKEDVLYRLLYESGEEMYSGMKLPEDAALFVQDQYNRFKIYLDQSIQLITYMGPGIAIQNIQQTDPYLIFSEYSDITLSEDWMNYTYEVTYDGESFEEINPEEIETYKYMPGNAQKFFDYYIAQPGFENLPEQITYPTHETLGLILDESSELYVPLETYPCNLDIVLLYKKLQDVFKNPDGSLDSRRIDACTDLSLWAGTLWFYGPYSRYLRNLCCPITNTALKTGEAVLYAGTVLHPKCYRKIARPPKSCYKCGIDAWCVEATIDDFGHSRFICEGCSCAGIDPYEGATCGARFCKYFNCPHNSYYQEGAGAMREGMRATGQLSAKAERLKKTIAERKETTYLKK